MQQQQGQQLQQVDQRAFEQMPSGQRPQSQTLDLSAKQFIIEIERFEGFVDHFNGDTAWVTLASPDGMEFEGKFPVAEFVALGIREHRRFTCRTLSVYGEIKVVVEPIADLPISPEEMSELDQALEELTSGNELDGDY